MFTPTWLAAHPGPHSVMGDDGMTPAARRGHRRASAGHASGAELAARIPGATLHLVEGARRAYFVEFREQAGPLVVGFMRDHPLA